MEGMKEKLLKASVIGVGGCGGNVLSSVYQDLKELGLPVEFSILNTDVQALSVLVKDKQFPQNRIFQIGERSTGGLGAGSNPNVGEASAKEDVELIRTLVTDRDLVLVLVGLGGGTGSGAIPIILKEAKDAGSLTLCWCIVPALYEGPSRNRIAKTALKSTDELSDSYIVISNDAPQSVLFMDGIKEVNEVVSTSIQIILEILMLSSLVNIDFADFTTVVRNGGKMLFSFARFDGDKRSEHVVKELTKFSLQPHVVTKKISKSLVFIKGGSDMRRDELSFVVDNVRSKLSDDVLIILGVATKEEKAPLSAVFLGTVGK